MPWKRVNGRPSTGYGCLWTLIALAAIAGIGIIVSMVTGAMEITTSP